MLPLRLMRVLSAFSLCVAASVPALAADEACTLEAGPTRAVTRIIDVSTLGLDDGSELRLAGILLPRAFDAGAEAATWAPERDALESLRELVLGRGVEIAFAGRRSDRYGRQFGHAFINRDGERIWVQGAMASAGHGRVSAGPDGFSCTSELMAHEAIARREAKGLWSNAAYQARPAARTYELMRYRNTFQLVRGRIAKVATTKSHTYLNFGRDWRVDFTVGIATSLTRRNVDWAASLKELEGREVTVRGWLERRNGPYIELADPAELELDQSAVAQGPGARGRALAPASGTPQLSGKEKRQAHEVPGAQGL